MTEKSSLEKSIEFMKNYKLEKEMNMTTNIRVSLLEYPWNKEAESIHQQCVDAGWWKPYPNKLDRFPTAMMLVISELAEAMEGDRKSLMDDHLPNHPMFDVEIADAAIRLLDSAGAYQLDLSSLTPYASYCDLDNRPVSEQLLLACRCATQINVQDAILATMGMVIAIAIHNEINLPALIKEKRAYNAKRLDHKKEVRENDKNGKKY